MTRSMEYLDRAFGVLLLVRSALHSYGSIAAYQLRTPELVWALSESLAGGLTDVIMPKRP